MSDEVLNYYICWRRGGNRADFESVCWLWFLAIKEYFDDEGDLYTDAYNRILSNYARLCVAIVMEGSKRIKGAGYEHVDQVSVFDFSERDRKKYDAIIRIDLEEKKIYFPEFKNPIDESTEFLKYARKTI